MLKETTINDKNNIKVIAKLHQGHFKVKIEKNCKNINFLSNSTRLVVQLTITKTDFETLLVRHIFHTFSRHWGQCQPWEGYHTLIPLITLILQCLIERAKLQRAAVWNITLGSHDKISIHNWIMKDHMVWNYVLLGYRLKTTYMSYKGHLKVKLAEILKMYTFTYFQPCWPLEIQHSFTEYVSHR